MLYRDIIKKLARGQAWTLDELAKSVGMRGQATLSMRLKDSWNPGMRDAQEILDKLNYEIVFAPKGTAQSKKLGDRCFVPEFPDRPE